MEQRIVFETLLFFCWKPKCKSKIRLVKQNVGGKQKENCKNVF